MYLLTVATSRIPLRPTSIRTVRTDSLGRDSLDQLGNHTVHPSSMPSYFSPSHPRRRVRVCVCPRLRFDPSSNDTAPSTVSYHSAKYAVCSYVRLVTLSCVKPLALRSPGITFAGIILGTQRVHPRLSPGGFRCFSLFRRRVAGALSRSSVTPLDLCDSPTIGLAPSRHVTSNPIDITLNIVAALARAARLHEPPLLPESCPDCVSLLTRSQQREMYTRRLQGAFVQGNVFGKYSY
jgi:hypothetical protein